MSTEADAPSDQSESGQGKPAAPLWLLAELTYACPLQCPYCSNPLDFAKHRGELSTAEWIRVLTEARALGSVQLGLSGGEPTTRQDLEEIVAAARGLGYYSNLITSAGGLKPERLAALKEAGLDHVQVSFAGGDAAINNQFTGSDSFEHKLTIARQAKALGYPMVLCFVLHRANIHQVADILRLAEQLGADYVELATTQYYGWALHNRAALLPNRQQLQQAETAVADWRKHSDGSMKVYYVVPDYYEQRPKACMNGWGSLYMVVTPDGVALPCHAARELPGDPFPQVQQHSMEWIWRESPGFRRFRGEDWMKPPCRDCPERQKDFGGCRCQAWQLTGDPANADPVCSKSPYRQLIDAVIDDTSDPKTPADLPVQLRNPGNSKRLSVAHDRPPKSP